MKIICSTNIPYAEEAFRPLGNLTILAPQEITADRVRDADVLVIRSTLRVNRALLEGSRVRFVGTATIGTDHLDLAYLDQAGITWCAAPGCNANSVAEYVITALLCLGQRHGWTLEGKTIGVVGVGNVGRRVVQKAQALGLRVLQNDPPRRAAENNPVFLPLEQVLAEADILTLHVPLTKTGPYPTWHLAERRFFEQIKPGVVWLNAARGAAMDSDAFLESRAAGKVAYAVLDTWEGEPVFRTDVLAKVDIATPHIAGHSFEGKAMGTVMVYHSLCRFLDIEPTWTLKGQLPPADRLPPPLVPEIRLDLPAVLRSAMQAGPAGLSEEAALWRIVRPVYDIEADDQRLRAGAAADPQTRGEHFEQLRKNYPIRREFRFTRVTLPSGHPRLEAKIRNLGFNYKA
ncbi:MAG: 4-phosphoerythronate dehydrogenase [Kiritimatiellota bacterium]|nr:4-phosphoerythronate dehydrogenase [Kiritimatiellota bacterium]